jgi:superfamily II DNA or RNA helicase
MQTKDQEISQKTLNLDFITKFPVIDTLTFPTNEGNFTVRQRIVGDLNDSKKLMIVTGYAGIEQLIKFISEFAANQEIMIVIGHEPSMAMRRSSREPAAKISDEMRDYWLNRGFSPRINSAVIDSIESIKSGRVQVRIHTERFLHAKATMTDTAAIFGSSNFSNAGLENSRELNGRHLWGSREYDLIRDFMSGCWERSEDYNDRFLDLLETLQQHVSWDEALARACAALLEGQWATNLLPPKLKEDFDNLWPHQKQAIAQGLSVLETQGSVVISDPTGSGKTRTGGWLFRLAYSRMIGRGGENTESLTPVMVCPSSVSNNWHAMLDSVGTPKEIISMGLLSNTKSDSTKRRLKLINGTNLLGVDEIHNFYNYKSARTKALSSNLAESRIFATATPINRRFDDLITLMRLLGTDDLDEGSYRKMKSLEDKIKDPNKNIRNVAIRDAKKLIGRFMVRRTRDELKDMANLRSDEYLLQDGVANYPEYSSKEYSIENNNDKDIIYSIEDDVEKITGLSKLPSKLYQTKSEKNMGKTEERVMDSRLILAKSGSKWDIWNFLDSSPVALIEHILGTDVAEKRYGLEGVKKGNSRSSGRVDKLEQMKIPEWCLSDEFKTSDMVPEWLTNEVEFNKKRMEEIELYKSIAEKTLELSDHRIMSKLKVIESTYTAQGKTLAFGSSIITLAHLKKLLENMGIEVDVFSGADGRTKKKKVETAEKLFGLKSDSSPRVGLFSDSMSEGINLQGTGVLIHLTYPTTIRKAEQRVGRVDRMDSKFDSITIYYPERDFISIKMRAHLKERTKLVKDLIGSNIKLPDEIDELSDSEEIDLSSARITEEMFTNREGLFDAFHGVRELIGEGKLISADTYEMMRSSQAKVVSSVGLVRSHSPWCLAVVQTNKDWAPQWVFLDWSKRESTDNAGISTELETICSSLLKNLEEADNLEPSEYSDKVIGDYIEHLSKKEKHLLPMRRRALLNQMSKVINYWIQKNYGYDSSEGKRLHSLAKAAAGSKLEALDLRQLAGQWVGFVKDHRDRFQSSVGSTRSRSKKLSLLKDNPPENIEYFLGRFSNVGHAEDFDSRIIALIAGIPDINS